MSRIQLLVVGALLTLAAIAILGDTAGAQVGNLDKACKKGYVLAAGPGTAYDTDGNGFVCVDPTTGDIRDDKGQFVDQSGSTPSGAAADENQDGLVCYDPMTGIYTDDDLGASGPSCPGEFVLYPAALVG